MSVMTVTQVQTFMQLLRMFLVAATELMKNSSDTLDCPCFNLLPKESCLISVQNYLCTLSCGIDLDLIAFTRLTRLYFQIRECVRTHSLQLLV